MTAVIAVAAVLVAAVCAGFVWMLRTISRLSRRLERQQREFAEELGRKMDDAEEARRRIVAILESMTEGVMVVEADERVLLVNTALEQAFGFPKKEMEGRFYWEILRDGEVNRMIGRALKEKTPHHEERAVGTGESIFEIQLSPVSNGADFLGVVGVFHDVTRIRRYDRMRQEFVANVSHELKTPLTSILGYIETLKEGAIDDTANRMRFLSVIEEHSLKLHRLIEDLLLLSRVESSAAPLRVERVSLHEEVHKAAELVARAAADKKLKVRVDVPETLEARVEPSSFERALRNLVENAVKYSHPGGEVVIEGRAGGGQVTLRVCDQGVGISEEDLPRIFERFYRVDPSRSRESGGSGLGLSIAKHILERHGGRIDVQSRPNEGSVFTIILPA